jgi:hypothetical protein
MRSSGLLALGALLAAASLSGAQPVPLEDDDKALAAGADALDARQFRLYGEGRLDESVRVAEEVLALRPAPAEQGRLRTWTPYLRPGGRELGILVPRTGPLSRLRKKSPRSIRAGVLGIDGPVTFAMAAGCSQAESPDRILAIPTAPGQNGANLQTACSASFCWLV